ncbi:MAG TPA: GNAT family N-acetyltransferase [Rhizomicrobium sp.]|nr:GNAT family N-acetyltransferase [Rhizomicrobium sp.]
MTISVRRMDAADVPALRELRLESLRLHPACFGADLEIEEAMSVEDMAARMRTGYTFGGFVDDVLSGLVVFVKPKNRKTGHTGELGAMYVRPNARGTGLGDALVEAVIDQAVATGAEQIKLTVNAENPHAIRLYERHGFRTIGRYPNSIRVDDRTYEELIMLRTVSPTD